MNREAMLAKLKDFFAQQAEELKPILDETQFAIYTEWIEKNLPGRVGWSPELITKIKTELALMTASLKWWML